MTRRGSRKKQTEVSDYRHEEERLNNPPAGLMADYDVAPAAGPKREYAYDPHLDPQLQFDSQGVRQQSGEQAEASL